MDLATLIPIVHFTDMAVTMTPSMVDIHPTMEVITHITEDIIVVCMEVITEDYMEDILLV